MNRLFFESLMRIRPKIGVNEIESREERVNIAFKYKNDVLELIDSIKTMLNRFLECNQSLIIIFILY